MRSDDQVQYIAEDDGSFKISGYNQAKAFSNFLPGVAGSFGIPLWAFYVNRGQGIASFGVDTKDAAIMQFFPANRSYEQTAIKGFRTFLKIKIGNKTFLKEPFQYDSQNQHQVMRIHADGFTLEDQDKETGLTFIVRYFGVPNESFAALARTIHIKNTSKKNLDIELIDGLPIITPFGLKECYLKDMSRTVEAWMTSSIEYSNQMPIAFYKLKSDPEDRPEFQSIDGAHFLASFAQLDKKRLHSQLIVDQDLIFGQRSDMVTPATFHAASGRLKLTEQIHDNKTPSAFSYYQFKLNPGKTMTAYALFGETKDATKIKARLKTVLTESYFRNKLIESKWVVDAIQNRANTISDLPEYDQYCRQTFLDNVLRGGLPIKTQTNGKDFILSIFSRKHGDLERDYNRFVVQPTYFSQGEGNFRDVNQNRRNDVWFEPAVSDSNIKMFYDLIQTDGYNPLVVEQVKLRFDSAKQVFQVLKSILSLKIAEQMQAFLAEPQTPGQIALKLESLGASRKQQESAFRELFTLAKRLDTARHGEGFWSEHWTYNLDLLESFLSVYPDQLQQTLFERKDYTFYDNSHRVQPRASKYFVTRSGSVRQYKAVVNDPEKIDLIASRQKDSEKVRTKNGKGIVYKTTLASKILCLIGNKISSLDPSGYGVEMEADKPDWYDALNGLPGLFGSSLSGSYELLRLCQFLKRSLKETQISEVLIPEEVADLLKGCLREVEKFFKNQKSTDRHLKFWNQTHLIKELYWHRTRLGVSGKESALNRETLEGMIESFEKKLKEGIRRAYHPEKEVPPTYFSHTVVAHKTQRVGKSIVVTPTKFMSRRLPHFLEGPVHAMRVESETSILNSVFKNVKKSDLYDKKLEMYLVTANLQGESPEIGRCRVFSPGWLENQSVFLHMEYKWLLELIRKGMYAQFFEEFKKCIIAFQDPKVYGRSIFENSSFIASSAFPNKKYHGNGFVARLSGSTAEFMDMWIRMNVGANPFYLNQEKELNFQLKPILPDWMFSKKSMNQTLVMANGLNEKVVTQHSAYAFTLFSDTLVIYQNRHRKSTFGAKAGTVVEMKIFEKGLKPRTIQGNQLGTRDAKALRNGLIKRIEAEIK